jgi:2-hydroxychromene-2-carboxylate isomerase
MSKEITVYYALQSPWTYLGWARLRQLVARSGATAHYRPIQIAPLFEASGTLALAQRPKQRQAYRLMELCRWRDHLGLPLNLHPKHFPVDESLAARMTIAHRQHGGDIAAFSQAMMTAVWAEERDLADRATLLEIARDQGADARTLLEAAQDPVVQREYDANTHAAIEQGVFGVPTFVIDDELFWGQDRLDFVARALGLLAEAGESR